MEERQMGARHYADARGPARLLGKPRLQHLWRSLARAALFRGRIMWRIGTVVALQDETPTARTIRFEVPDWPSHVAGQNVDVRLTAAAGYSAVRLYSIDSAPNDCRLIELKDERVHTDEE